MVIYKAQWYQNFVTITDEKRVIVAHVKKLIKEKRVQTMLEIGAGTKPFFAQNLAPLVDHYTIVEREDVTFHLPPNVTYLHDDWEHMQLTEKYDFILASHVYYYFKDKKAAVQKAFQALTKQGRVLFTVNSPDPDYGPMKRAFAAMIGTTHSFAHDELLEHLAPYNVKEYSVTSTVSANSYDELYEALRMSFDHHPHEYTTNKDKIIAYFKEQFGKPQFKIQQKLLLATEKS